MFFVLPFLLLESWQKHVIDMDMKRNALRLEKKYNEDSEKSICKNKIKGGVITWLEDRYLIRKDLKMLKQ